MVTAPINDFGLPPRAQDFLFIAGGIGITPIMAMIREVIAQKKRFRLYYCSRSPETTAFRDELAAPEFAEFVTIHYDHCIANWAGSLSSRSSDGPMLTVIETNVRPTRRAGDQARMQWRANKTRSPFLMT